eukprot:TRINITY_DN71575_c0_g1_i1.p1 TRINITY_DN71575_c0_g1~~TRINITY_DN71575_c0_g1_i1.p1  ORF type:complete len:312 (-),score=50.34 TRINITY_DN71575_c0_g1_i1:113-967(-)
MPFPLLLAQFRFQGVRLLTAPSRVTRPQPWAHEESCLLLCRGSRRWLRKETFFWQGDEKTIVIKPPKQRSVPGKLDIGAKLGDQNISSRQGLSDGASPKKLARQKFPPSSPPRFFAKLAEPMDTPRLDLIKTTNDLTKKHNAILRRLELLGGEGHSAQLLQTELTNLKERLEGLRGRRTDLKLRMRKKQLQPLDEESATQQQLTHPGDGEVLATSQAHALDEQPACPSAAQTQSAPSTSSQSSSSVPPSCSVSGAPMDALRQSRDSRRETVFESLLPYKSEHGK